MKLNFSELAVLFFSNGLKFLSATSIFLQGEALSCILNQAEQLGAEVEGLRARVADAAALETSLAVARADLESARRSRDELLVRIDAQAAELRRCASPIKCSFSFLVRR